MTENINIDNLAELLIERIAAKLGVEQAPTPDQIDVEGKPLNPDGHGVHDKVDVQLCKQCGSNIARVPAYRKDETGRRTTEFKVYGKDVKTPENLSWLEGKPVTYLAQAYLKSDGTWYALVYQPHSRFCTGPDSPDSNDVKDEARAQAERDKASAAELERESSKNEMLGRAEQYEGPASTEVNEPGSDDLLGFMAAGDELDNLPEDAMTKLISVDLDTILPLLEGEA